MSTTSTGAGVTYCLTLDDATARNPEVSGSKAACLALARAHGIRTIAGFVVTTAVHERFLRAGHQVSDEVAAGLREAWSTTSRDGEVPLVVRSSSTVEDVGASSMAGRFRSVLDVRGWPAFLDALAAVLRSADQVGGSAGPSPMGVLVQPFVVPACGGVMFGVDPVSGDASHVVVEAVAGGPDALVSGRVTAQHYVASPRGRLLAVDHRPERVLSVHRSVHRLLSGRQVRALATLAAHARRAFGGPQDVEWAFDAEGTLLLLQSRPVTATGEAALATGPVLGPGPVAETFPDPLGPLEIDLWVGPLRTGVVAALREIGAVAPRRLDDSPVVTTIRGRVVADLELFGYVPHRVAWAMLDPRPPLRRLRAAWHVGRLRALLPQRVPALVREVDEFLAAVVPTEMSDAQLLQLLEQCTGLLARLHHDEVLAGTLLPAGPRTASAIALDVLADHADRADHANPDVLAGPAVRADLADDLAGDALVRRHPVLLSLCPPAVGVPLTLPPSPMARPRPRTGAVADIGPREQLRLRARWVQELTARASWLLGRRLAERGVLDAPASVALLDLASLRVAVAEERPPLDLHDRLERTLADAFAPPLPTQLRLTPSGEPVPAARIGARPGGGTGAGGGRGSGPVVHVSARTRPAVGDVVVVRDLAPELAAWLPGLAGLVAETGGTLSHLAILAREYGVPTVVGVHDALRRFPAGARVVVDGTMGEVQHVGGDDAA
ncbi:MAG TPA: PEP/pyruvate-binding domain-containing protein [Jiangellales bacterium]|nr:PEP/pyruvate-binding domain-containing protein [Jiangellales bacterium]